MGLKLKATDLDDLSILSGMVQDSLVPIGDMLFLPDEGSFILALNRFQWEWSGTGPPYFRGHSGLRFDKVTSVARKGLSKQEPEKMLNLLALAYAPAEGAKDDATSGPGSIVLQFSEEAAVRLTVEDVLAGLEDFGDPWPTQWMPTHTPD